MHACQISQTMCIPCIVNSFAFKVVGEGTTRSRLTNTLYLENGHLQPAISSEQARSQFYSECHMTWSLNHMYNQREELTY